MKQTKSLLFIIITIHLLQLINADACARLIYKMAGVFKDLPKLRRELKVVTKNNKITGYAKFEGNNLLSGEAVGQPSRVQKFTQYLEDKKKNNSEIDVLKTNIHPKIPIKIPLHFKIKLRKDPNLPSKTKDAKGNPIPNYRGPSMKDMVDEKGNILKEYKPKTETDKADIKEKAAKKLKGKENKAGKVKEEKKVTKEAK